MTVRTHLRAGAPAPSAPPSVNVRPRPCRPPALRDLPAHFCSSSLSTSNCEDGSSLPTEPRIWILSESVLFTHLKLCHWRSRAGDLAAGVSPLVAQPILSWTEGLSGLINAQWAAGWPEAPPHPRPADSGRLRSCKKTVLCRILYCSSSQGSDVRLVALRAFHFSMLGWGLLGSS